MATHAGTAFGQSIDKYIGFRPKPPRTTFDIIAKAVGHPRARAVDLGAGTGHGTQPLLALFDKVTAVEIDQVMAAELAGLGDNLDVQVGPAEEADFDEGSLDLVTACMSFHWMDRELMAPRIASWLRPGGVFALYGYGQLAFPDAASLHELIEVEKHTRWTQFFPHEVHNKKHQQVLAEFPVFDLAEHHVPHFVSMTAEEITGHMASTSTGGAWARSTGDVEGYWADFQSQLEALDMPWPTSVDFSRQVILATKRAAA